MSDEHGDDASDKDFDRSETEDGRSNGRSPVVVIMQTPRKPDKDINCDGGLLSESATSKMAAHGGIVYVAKAVELLSAAGVVCCMSYEPALVYFGAKRAISVS